MNRILASAVAIAAACTAASIQAAPPTSQPADSRLDRLERRLDQLQEKYDTDMKSRDDEIAQLKSQIAHPAQQAAPTAPSANDIDKTTQDMLQDIQSKESAPPTIRVPASFNPNFAVISDFAGNTSSDHENPARNRFDLREVELDLRAAVDPRADAVVILPIDREVSDPLFFNPTRADGSIDTSIDIEEAYINLHDFGVPNLTAKLGRFHLRFGRWNLLHLHNWPTVDNAFVVQSFLGPESLVDSGVSFSYQVPPAMVNNEYLEADVEVISGVGDTSDPVLNNGAFVSTPGVNVHALWNHDLTQNINFEWGGSFLHGHHNSDANQYANVFGTDFTLMHTDPTGRFNNQLFQTEVMAGNVDNGANNPQHSMGAFIIAQQQLNRDWYTGVRLDWTKNAVNEHQEVWGVSPYLTWYWSEFLMFRTEYQHKAGDVPTEDSLWFQCDFVFGAHPPHPYWAAK
jgi:hypothetical protein